MKIHPLKLPKVGDMWYYVDEIYPINPRRWTITRVSYKENIIWYKNMKNIDAVENEKDLHIFQQQVISGQICYEN